MFQRVFRFASKIRREKRASRSRLNTLYTHFGLENTSREDYDDRHVLSIPESTLEADEGDGVPYSQIRRKGAPTSVPNAPLSPHSSERTDLITVLTVVVCLYTKRERGDVSSRLSLRVELQQIINRRGKRASLSRYSFARRVRSHVSVDPLISRDQDTKHCISGTIYMSPSTLSAT